MAKLDALRRGGASIRGMARELGLSATTVARLVKEHAALDCPRCARRSYRDPRFRGSPLQAGENHVYEYLTTRSSDDNVIGTNPENPLDFYISLARGDRPTLL
jgi:hypothetical protein